MDETKIERKVYVNYGNSEINLDELKNIVDHVHDNKSILDRITEDMLNKWEFDSNLDERLKALEEKDIYLLNKINNDISTINIRINEEIGTVNNTILQEKTFILSEIDKINKQLGLESDSISNQLAEINAKINNLEKYAANTYSTKEELDECLNKLNTHTHSYLSLTDKPVIPSIDGLASEKFVNQKIEEAKLGSEVDLSDYATKEELKEKANINHIHSYNDLKDIPEDLATEEYVQNAIEDFRLNQKEIDLTDYATINYVDTGLESKADKDHEHDYLRAEDLPEIPSIDGLATETFVTNKIAEAQLAGGDKEIDLSGYATKDDLKLKADKEHTHDYLTEIPEEYITQTELQEIVTSFENQLNEVKSCVSNGKKLLADALTDQGIETSAEETFESIANKILMLGKYQPEQPLPGIILVTRDGVPIVTRDNKYINIKKDTREKTSVVTMDGEKIVTIDNKTIIIK